MSHRTSKKGPKPNGEQRQQSHQQPKQVPKQVPNPTAQQHTKQQKKQQQGQTQNNQQQKQHVIFDPDDELDIDVQSSAAPEDGEWRSRMESFFPAQSFNPTYQFPSRATSEPASLLDTQMTDSRKTKLELFGPVPSNNPAITGTSSCPQCAEERIRREKAEELAEELAEDKARLQGLLNQAETKVSQTAQGNSPPKPAQVPSFQTTTNTTQPQPQPRPAPVVTFPVPNSSQPKPPVPAMPLNATPPPQGPLLGRPRQTPQPPPLPPIISQLPTHLASLRTLLTLRHHLLTLQSSITKSKAISLTLDNAFSLPEHRNPYTTQIETLFTALLEELAPYVEFVTWFGQKAETRAKRGCRDLIMGPKTWQVLRGVERMCVLWEGEVLRLENTVLLQLKRCRGAADGASQQQNPPKNIMMKKRWEEYQGAVIEFGRLVSGGRGVVESVAREVVVATRNLKR
ncbi:hypothetical protein QBC44DRAFT_44111 [Cladorrhinum sp. PSN332]|nr:hypothetical protein QBC44DRAFT_44111 [Cladorrhinum sp. PSN332]